MDRFYVFLLNPSDIQTYDVDTLDEVTTILRDAVADGVIDGESDFYVIKGREIETKVQEDIKVSFRLNHSQQTHLDFSFAAE